MGKMKDRNSKDLIEAEEIRKRWKEYREELYKKQILMTQTTTMVQSLTQSQTFWSVKSSGPQEALPTELVEVMEFQQSYLKVLKDEAIKVLHTICQQIWKTQQWPQDQKRSVIIPVSKLYEDYKTFQNQHQKRYSIYHRELECKIRSQETRFKLLDNCIHLPCK